MAQLYINGAMGKMKVTPNSATAAYWLKLASGKNNAMAGRIGADN
jgi:hypothetical protein